jgi:hypothetical protein
MKLLRAALKPTAATLAEFGWLLDLVHSKQASIKFACGVFAAFGGRDLEMVKVCDAKSHGV